MTDVDPFVFVAATRYAILRPLTGASEIIAGQVLMHAELIRGDVGAAGAIRDEVEVSRAQLSEPAGFGQSKYERDRVVEAWDRVVEALAPEPSSRWGAP